MMANNKIIFGGNVLLDLTQDSVEAEKVLSGFTFHGKDGKPGVGSCTFDLDTSELTAKAAEILATKTAGVNGVVITGSMPNNGAVAGIIKTIAGEYVVPLGYHDGSGKVVIDPAEAAKLIASNIREGVTILGVTGTMTGTESVTAQSRTVTPAAAAQTVLPEEGYNYLSQVIVEAIPYVSTPNAAGGNTVTIG